MVYYANRQRVKGLPLEEGDAIYLLRQNIKIKQPSNKLDYKRLRPFKILQKFLDVSYKLNLPGTTKLHNRFHVSLLKPAPLEVPLQQKLHVKDPKEYKVEAILDHRGTKPNEEYLVK